MIGHLRGRILSKSAETILVDAGGVGYEICVPLSTLSKIPEVHSEAALFIHTHVREDAIQLYGFHTRQELDLFRMLIHTRDIGPRLALNILSVMGPSAFLDAVSRKEVSLLRRVPGLGPKKAEKIILELKDKVGTFPVAETGAVEGRASREDLLSALRNLGYRNEEAAEAVGRAMAGAPGAALEHLLRESLKLLYRR